MANPSDYTYEKIETPYNSLLERSSEGLISQSTEGVVQDENGESVDSTSSEGTNSNLGSTQIENPSQVSPGSVGSKSLDNLWITNWIKSKNYQPKAVGFLIDGIRGYIECRDFYSNNILVEGGIIGGWHILPGYIYSLTSGTPLVAPNNGIVMASTNPAITVYEGTNKRTVMGYLSAGVYGLKGYATDGTTTLFELSDTQNIIAGWTISQTTLANGTNIILDASNKAISINNATFGTQGVQLQYNAGTPRVYFGNGTNYFFNFDGTNISWGAVATTLSTAGLFTTTSALIGGWSVDSTSIKDAAGVVGMSSAVTVGDDIRFWCGNVTPASSPFYVTEAGVIKAFSGTVGGCTLAATSIGSTTFVSGPLGSGWNISNTGTAEFQNVIVRGIIRTTVFEKDTISAVNGMVLISSADVLNADMTALDASTVVITGETTFVNNEVIRVKDGTSDEWMLVTDASGAPTYIVTRDLAGSYAPNVNPIWKKGTAIVSMGVGTGAKTGFILLDSSSSNSPYIDIYGRNSNTYTDYTLHGRFGWLKGITDADVGLAATDVWGLYTDNAYIKGVIVANTGYIGGTTGWVISSNYIKDVAGVTGLSSVVTAGDDIRIWAGHATPASAPFYVTEAGALVATSATISGSITATTGAIGGWIVGATSLTDVAGIVGMSSAVTGGDDIRFWAGDVTPASAEFRVYESGALVASSATITGSVTATSGTIGGFEIGSTYLRDVANTEGFSSETTDDASNTGLILPDTGADDAAVGTVAWSNPTNIQLDDATDATVGAAPVANPAVSHYLKGTNFGLSVPGNATITGVVVTIKRYKTSFAGGVTDNIVKLVKGGSVVGNNKNNVNNWAGAYEVITYGSSSDLWGTTLTPAEVNASDFGAVLSANIFALAGGPTVAHVDYFKINVYYTTPAVRIWAGDTFANRAIAPFRVLRNGNVYMKDVMASNLMLYDAVVDAAGNGDFTDVQSAIDSLSNGGTIFVRNGTYFISTKLTISQNNLHIFGENSNLTVIYLSDGSNSDMLSISDSVTDTVLQNIQFDGNKLNQASGAGVGYNINLGNLVSQIRIKDCIIKNGFRGGIFTHSISDSFFVQNIFDGNGSLGFGMWGQGTSIILSQNIFKNNQDGLSLPVAFDCAIVGNIFMNNSVTGISIFANGEAKDILITGNTIVDNGIGIRAIVGGFGVVNKLTITGNQIFDSNSYGIEMQGIGESVISGNSIHTNGSDGIYLDSGGAYISITGNSIHLNSGNGIKIIGGNGVNICSNSITFNGLHGIYYDTDFSVIDGNKLSYNGYTGGAAYYNIFMNSGSTDNIITSNIMQTSRNYNYRENAATCDYNIVTSNRATGAIVANISIQGVNDVNANNIVV